MTQLYKESGDLSGISVSSPALQGLFVPSIDKSLYGNGLGLVTPWGSGATARGYTAYGTSEASSSYDSLLNDLGTSLMGGGKSLSYDIGGLTGPQGPAGPQGPPGITTIQQVVIGGATDPSSILAQLELWNAAEDTIPYGATSHTEWEEGWTKMDVAGVRTWNDAAISEDGSFMLLAFDAGLYISVDSGDTWTLSEPSAGSFIGAAVSDTDGNAVALEEEGADYGKVWVSGDYGETWMEITLAGTGAE